MSGIKSDLAKDAIAPDSLPIYQAAATKMATGMAQTLADRITAAISEARVAGAGLPQIITAVRDSMDTGGYTVDHPHLLRT